MNFTEAQMRDPWAWCMSVLNQEGWTSKQVAENVGAPWSTVRSLYNGTSVKPRYDLLQDIIALCIAIETGPKEVVTHDFL